MFNNDKSRVHKRIKYTDNVFNRISLIISDNLRSIYEYNNIVKNYGYYLKPIHVVVKKSGSGAVKYYYYGRYWYRLEYTRGNKRKLKWIYIGKEKPDKKLPDPPTNPLEGTVIKIRRGTIEISGSKEALSILSRAFRSGPLDYEGKNDNEN
ncbi:hypothetical protein [Staphylothermus hellenicus]|uniref:Uncharacterized protein n=1 Tax=Staphylothermus hellenicus (strain DSM 12710 / JCM 10830 / BK20S6-10-b1 / P8) TaxID=591019 RepID=D7DC30_STAHD|nr:hypothetical protein [Staphylothermus hellenicus]ADI31727.1 hypothetical protein Shell_0602 [Staphylothermus hellenicus DSM 12710]